MSRGLARSRRSVDGHYYKPENDSHHFVFRFRVEDGSAPLPSSEEISDCGYFRRDELPRPISHFTLQRLDDALAGTAPDAVVTIERLSWLE